MVERPWRKAIGSAADGGRQKSFFSRAVVAQLVERVLGKDEVIGSIPINGSSILIVHNGARRQYRLLFRGCRRALCSSEFG